MVVVLPIERHDLLALRRLRQRCEEVTLVFVREEGWCSCQRQAPIRLPVDPVALEREPDGPDLELGYPPLKASRLRIE